MAIAYSIVMDNLSWKPEAQEELIKACMFPTERETYERERDVAIAEANADALGVLTSMGFDFAQPIG